MGLFGKEKPPKERMREWSGQLRKETRVLDRQILGIQREEEKVKRQLKSLAKTGDRQACLVLAKEVIRSRKAISKIHVAKAQLKSVEYSMNQQLATMRVAGSIQKSGEVMKSMQELVKVPEISATMRDLSKEMMKMGLIEEMMEDAMDVVGDDEELDEEAQDEVDKVLFEITAGKMVGAPEPIDDSLPVAHTEEDVDVSDMQDRLQALRS